MRHYLCDIETVQEDGKTIYRPSIARHIDDWNTFKSHNAARTLALVACEPSSLQRVAIEGDASCRYVCETDEAFEDAVQSVARRPAVSVGEQSRIQSVVDAASITMTVGRVSPDEIKDGLIAALRNG